MSRDSTEPHSRVQIRVERRGVRRYICSGCGRGTSRVRDQRDRTWHDLPWAAHPVMVVYTQRRVRCRECGMRTERMAFGDHKARVTCRVLKLICVECEYMS